MLIVCLPPLMACYETEPAVAVWFRAMDNTIACFNSSQVDDSNSCLPAVGLANVFQHLNVKEAAAPVSKPKTTSAPDRSSTRASGGVRAARRTAAAPLGKYWLRRRDERG